MFGVGVAGEGVGVDLFQAVTVDRLLVFGEVFVIDFVGKCLQGVAKGERGVVGVVVLWVGFAFDDFFHDVVAGYRLVAVHCDGVARTVKGVAFVCRVGNGEGFAQGARSRLVGRGCVFFGDDGEDRFYGLGCWGWSDGLAAAPPRS